MSGQARPAPPLRGFGERNPSRLGLQKCHKRLENIAANPDGEDPAVLGPISLPGRTPAKTRLFTNSCAEPIYPTHQGKQYLVKAGHATHGLRIPPNLTYFGQLHILARNVPVQYGLVQRVTALHGDIVHFVREG
jgi:hypothetical protein